MSSDENIPSKQHVQADIIILGSSIPGLVTAYKLKQKFGDSMDIVVLDLDNDFGSRPTFNVSFNTGVKKAEEKTASRPVVGTEEMLDILSHQYIVTYADEFNIALPQHAVRHHPDNPGMKIFERRGGGAVKFTGSYHGFHYLNLLERFELRQLQSLLTALTREVFVYTADGDANSRRDAGDLATHDECSMETMLRACLVLESSRDVMRATVRVVCGGEADKVSVLFYLRQCYRVNGAHNQLDGRDVRTRERVLSACKRHIVERLLEHTADITVVCTPIWQIRMYTNRQVILETFKGNTNYVCSVLAMALRPDELTEIRVDYRLLNHRSDVEMLLRMQSGTTRLFQVEYEQPFWREMGYSGDIFSLQGPITWAMEKPTNSGTGSKGKYFKLVGYLKPRDGKIAASEESDDGTMEGEVVAQLVRLFGTAAALPVLYKESSFVDVFVPLCGDYLGVTALLATMRNTASVEAPWTSAGESAFIEWAALDLYGAGDLNAALEAGHQAYVSLLYRLRPQAQTFNDISRYGIPTVLTRLPSRLVRTAAQLNVLTGARLALLIALACLAAKVTKELITRLCWYMLSKKMRSIVRKQ